MLSPPNPSAARRVLPFQHAVYHVEGDVRCIEVQRGKRGVMHHGRKRMSYWAAKHTINGRYCHVRISSIARFNRETLSIPGDARFPVNPYGRILGEMCCPTYP